MLGLQLPPFFDLLGVVLQLGAHDAFHEAREVGSSISQSADNEVGALLSCPTQIDCPDVRSAQEISVEVRRSKTLVGEIFVGVRRSKTDARAFHRLTEIKSTCTWAYRQFDAVALFAAAYKSIFYVFCQVLMIPLQSQNVISL